MRHLLLLSGVFITCPIFAADDPKKLVYDGKPLTEWIDGLQAKEAVDRSRASIAITAMVRSNHSVAKGVVEKLIQKADADEQALLARAEAYGDMLRAIGKPAAEAFHPYLWAVDPDRKLRALVFLAVMGDAARPALPGVIEILERDQHPQRLRTALYIARRNDDLTLLPVFLRLLENENTDLAQDVANLLLNQNYPVESYMPVLKKWLKGKDQERRTLALSCLSQLDREAFAAVDDLIPLLSGNNVGDRSYAIRILRNIGPEAKAALPALEKLFRAKEVEYKLQIAWALLAIANHAGARAELESVMKEGTSSDRFRIAAVLWQQSRSPLVPAAINQILEKGDKEERLRAVSWASNLSPVVREAIPLLIAALEDPDETMKLHAMQALGRMGPDARKAIEPLKAIVKKGKRDERYFAVMNLARIDPSAFVVEQLIEFVGSEGAGTAGSALRALAIMKEKAKDALPAIRKRFDDKDPYIRLYALDASWEIGRAASTREAWLEELRRSSPVDRHDLAINYVDQFGIEAAPLVDEWMPLIWEDLSYSGVIEAIGWIGPAAKKAVPVLQRLLLTSVADASVHSAACEALGTIGADAKPALPALRSMLKHTNALVRIHAALALQRIDNDRSGETIIASSLRNRKYQVRITALELQWLLKKDQPTVEALIHELRDAVLRSAEDAGNQCFMAVRALGRIGTPAKVALPDLKDLLYNEDPTLCKHVREAIRKIEGKR